MVVKLRLMRFARITPLSLCLLVAGFIQSCQAAKDSPENIKRLLDPHHHVVDVTGEQPVDIPDFAIVEASVDPVLRRENITDNQAETLRAFCIYEFAQNEYSRYRIFAEELQTGTTYEIQGLPLPRLYPSPMLRASNTRLKAADFGKPPRISGCRMANRPTENTHAAKSANARAPTHR